MHVIASTNDHRTLRVACLAHCFCGHVFFSLTIPSFPVARRSIGILVVSRRNSSHASLIRCHINVSVPALLEFAGTHLYGLVAMLRFFSNNLHTVSLGMISMMERARFLTCWTVNF